MIGIVAALVAGCRHTADGVDGAGLSQGMGAATSSSGSGVDDAEDSGGGLADSGAAQESGSGTSPLVYDLGGGDATPEDTCVAVDLLFIVDNSLSMQDNQQSLIDSFPGFVSGMEDRLPPQTDFRVGVTTSDAYRAHAPECQELGALVTQTTGDASSEAVCGPYAGGTPYMTADDDLAETFACAAQVGIDGVQREEPIGALLGALNDELNGPVGCNAGFIRDDAVLVVVLITDEDQVPASCCYVYDPELCPNAPFCLGTEGDPAEWRTALLDAKGGNEDAVVVLSLVGVDTSCPSVFEPGDRLVEFTESFEHGLVGDVCASTYDDFFAAALEPIVEACEQFPEG